MFQTALIIFVFPSRGYRLLQQYPAHEKKDLSILFSLFFLPLVVLAISLAEANLLGLDILGIGFMNLIGIFSYIFFFYSSFLVAMGLRSGKLVDFTIFLVFLFPVFFPALLILPVSLLGVSSELLTFVYLSIFVILVWSSVRHFRALKALSLFFGRTALFPLLVSVGGGLFLFSFYGMMFLIYPWITKMFPMNVNFSL